MYEARSAEDIRIYESIVIEFLLRLKIHNIGRPTCVSRLDIQKHGKLWNISHAVSCWNIYIVRDPANVIITVDSQIRIYRFNSKFNVTGVF